MLKGLRGAARHLDLRALWSETSRQRPALAAAEGQRSTQYKLARRDDEMEVAKLILEFFKVLAWPAVVLALCVGFRKELRNLTARITHAELPGGVTVDFPQEIQKARELSAQVEAAPPHGQKKGVPVIPLTEANARLIQLGFRPSPSGLDMGYYRALASQDPTLALAGLRIEIDILARNLAKGFNVAFDERDSGIRLIRKLHVGDALTDEQTQLAVKVLQLCNAAIHGTPVSREQAEAVIDIADVLAAQYLSWLSWGFEDGWKPSQLQVTNRTAG